MQEIPSRPQRLAVTVLAVSLLAGASLGAPGASGQESDPGDEPDAAFLFAYRPNPGQEEDFRAGYRRHLNGSEGDRTAIADAARGRESRGTMISSCSSSACPPFPSAEIG